MNSPRRIGRSLLLLAAAASLLLPAFPLLPAAQFASAQQSQTPATTFYLHDDGAGFGHPGKRFDWANTSAPYNPVNPNFISSSYQGIEMNTSGVMQSFRWIAWPAAGAAILLGGFFNATFYMTPSNTSSPYFSFTVQLQNATSLNSTPAVVASISTGQIRLSPDTPVTVSLKLNTSTLGSGDMLLLNLTRTDSNSGSSVYVGFDYNSAPSSFSLSLSPRISSVAVQQPPNLHGGVPFTIFANVTDELGSTDVASALISATGQGGYSALNSTPMARYSPGGSQTMTYVAAFEYTLTLPYGNYTVNITAESASTLSGYSVNSTSFAYIQIPPSLQSFSVTASGRSQAGIPFSVSATAYSDGGSVMYDFNGSASVRLLYTNGTQLAASAYSAISAIFSSGHSSFIENVTLSATIVVEVYNGSASGDSQPVNITAGPVSLVKVHPSVVSLQAGQKQQFSATGYDAYGNINSSWNATWAVQGGLGTITPAGLFTATVNGSTNVSATDSATGASGSASVAISPSSLYNLTITPSLAGVQAGQTYFFTAYGYDYFGNPVALQGVVWETNAGSMYPNGSSAMLIASKSTMDGAWVEAFSGGLTYTVVFNITPSAFSPQELAPIQAQSWPSGTSLSLNLTSYFSDPNDPTGSQMAWYISGGSGIVYSYGQGVDGDLQMVLVPYSGAYGNASMTLSVTNTQGYTVTETFNISVLPRPHWINSLPQYMTVPASTYYMLNYTYFLDGSPLPALSLAITTSSPYVYVLGHRLAYFFPVAAASGTYPVVITATNSYNVSSSVVQIVTVSSQPPPAVNTAGAPPSSLTISRGDSLTLEYPLETYFVSQQSLTFSVASTGAYSSLSRGNILHIEAPAAGTADSGSVLIKAENQAGEFAFLLISLNIQSVISPPSVAPLPQIRVMYSTSGSANYALPLLRYVTDTYVPLSQVTVITGTSYITFSIGNFSLLFSMPSSQNGTGPYAGQYWFNTTIVFVGGPISSLDQDSVTVPLSVLVSSTPPPGRVPGVQLPAYITLAENTVYSSLNLTYYITSPGADRLHFTVTGSSVLGASVAPDGVVTIAPAKYFSGMLPLFFEANSSSGFYDFRVLVEVYAVYIPPIITLPQVLTLNSTSSVINLSAYISNPNGDPLKISAVGKGVTVVGTEMLVVLSSGVSSETLTLVFTTASGATLTRQLTLHLSNGFPSIYAIMFYALLAVMVAAAAVLIFQRLIPKPFQLESVLLIHNDGRLLSHTHRQDYSGVDRDILVGMFTAIQDFVSTSFPEMEGERQVLSRIELGRFSIYVERGSNAFILAIYSGEPPRGWYANIRTVLGMIEESYSLSTWDGRRESIRGIDAEIAGLFPGKTQEMKDEAAPQ